MPQMGASTKDAHHRDNDADRRVGHLRVPAHQRVLFKRCNHCPSVGVWHNLSSALAGDALPIITAGITAFYMCRLWFMTFTGKPRDAHVYDHAHESTRS